MFAINCCRHVVLLLTLSVAGVSYAQEEEQSPGIYISYIGETYQQIEVYDQKRQLVIARRLVSGQGLSYPNMTKKTRLKTFFIKVGDVEYKVKHGCKKKQLARPLPQDDLKISYHNTKPACIVDIQYVNGARPKADEETPLAT